MPRKEVKPKQPWPTKKAMEQIYELNLWGGGEAEFYSGLGSHHLELLEPYVNVVSTFLKSFEAPLTVCDLGCGDFNVGRHLLPYCKQYVGVDIVEPLIQRNKEKFRQEGLAFVSLDIAEDELPDGDCVLLRQVLQHLSNAEVEKVLNKLSKYKYVILTEHIPEGNFEPNLDIISGQGIRLKKNSGLDITAPPFNYKYHEVRELLRLTVKEHPGEVVTNFFKSF